MRPGPAVLCLVLIAAWLGGAAAVAQDSGSTGQDSANQDPPAEDRPWDERIAVKAEIGGVTSGPIGASSTVIEPSRTTIAPTSLVNLVAHVPGVAENGQGGLFQVYSIRGVSRWRVTSLIDGMRLTSERRAGVSASFVDPLLMGSVEVLRGPSTTFYGSGALGGVIQVMPRWFDGWSLDAGYTTEGDAHYQVAGTGDDNWSVGVAHRRSSDSETPDGALLPSHYEQYSAVLGYRWQRKKLQFDLLAIPTYTEDVGKPNTDFYQGRITEYPRERHNMLKFAVRSVDGWSFQAWAHDHDLETEVFDQPDDQHSLVSNETLDYGLRFEHEVPSGSVSLRYGVDVFGRNGVDADELREPLSGGPAVMFSTLDGAEEVESGLFAAARWTGSKIVAEVGGRFSYQTQENGTTVERDRRSWNGFAGVSRQMNERLSLRAGVSSGLRFPSLSEQFFTGTTGSGEVFGNPNLDEERSLNSELAVSWTGTRVIVKGVVFNNRIDDYIERVDDELTDTRTFVNLTSGTIRGVEIQGLVLPGADWLIHWGGHIVEGRDSGDNPLADVPVDSVYLGFGHRMGEWDFDARLEHRNAKNDPGDGERPIPSAELLTASVAYDIAPGWRVALRGANLLDDTYKTTADRRAVPAPERSFSIHLVRRQ